MVRGGPATARCNGEAGSSSLEIEASHAATRRDEFKTHLTQAYDKHPQGVQQYNTF
jgi:hypothetical protein